MTWNELSMQKQSIILTKVKHVKTVPYHDTEKVKHEKPTQYNDMERIKHIKPQSSIMTCKELNT